MVSGADNIGVGTIVSHSLAGVAVFSWTWLPPTLAGIASALAIIFYCIQIRKALKG